MFYSYIFNTSIAIITVFKLSHMNIQLSYHSRQYNSYPWWPQFWLVENMDFRYSYFKLFCSWLHCVLCYVYHWQSLFAYHLQDYLLQHCITNHFFLLPAHPWAVEEGLWSPLTLTLLCASKLWLFRVTLSNVGWSLHASESSLFQNSDNDEASCKLIVNGVCFLGWSSMTDLCKQ